MQLRLKGYISSKTPQSSEKPSQKCKGCYKSKRGLNLEWEDQQAHMGVIVKCLQTFGHILYLGIFFFSAVFVIHTKGCG